MNKSVVVDREKISAEFVRGYSFLVYLSDEQRRRANDPHQSERASWQTLARG